MRFCHTLHVLLHFMLYHTRSTSLHPSDSYSTSLLIWYHQPQPVVPVLPFEAGQGLDSVTGPGLGLNSVTGLGLALAPSIEPLPPKLVQRIRSGHFLELKELLPDNMALQQQLDALHGHLASPLLPPSLKPWFREISSPVSWAVCFPTYAAVRTQDPATRGHLVYARLVLQEALRHGGSGWLDYDRVPQAGSLGPVTTLGLYSPSSPLKSYSRSAQGFGIVLHTVQGCGPFGYPLRPGTIATTSRISLTRGPESTSDSV